MKDSILIIIVVLVIFGALAFTQYNKTSQQEIAQANPTPVAPNVNPIPSPNLNPSPTVPPSETCWISLHDLSTGKRMTCRKTEITQYYRDSSCTLNGIVGTKVCFAVGRHWLVRESPHEIKRMLDE
jgi:hypothetical protein